MAQLNHSPNHHMQQDALPQARLLVVEDCEVQAKLLQSVLAKNGFEVEVAKNGGEAWAKIKARRPDLVISDILMPEVGGYELCKLIRAEDHLNNLPIVLLSSLANFEGMLEGLASGADNFISKPYKVPQLLAVVRAQLAKAKRQEPAGNDGVLITKGHNNYLIKEKPEKILDFLVSMHGVALEKNAELAQTQAELMQANDKLAHKVQERALALVAESSQRQETEEALARMRIHQALILNSIWEGVLGLGLAGHISFVNPAAAAMLGYETLDILGQPAYTVCQFSQADGRPYSEDTCPFYATLKDGKVRLMGGIFWRQDGSSFPAEGTSTAIIENGRITGAVITFRDITERKRTEEALRQAFEGAVKALAHTVEARDPYTAGHQWRTTILACAIAMEMGLPQDRIDIIRIAGTLHDIGKIQVPVEILTKPTKLSEPEFSLIQTHPQVGQEIVKAVAFPGQVAEIIGQHHERLDGSGYPKGLKGDETLLEARILAVADVVEAMVSHRPYRPALGIDKALAEISRNRGILYDPQIADACLRLFTEKGFQFRDDPVSGCSATSCVYKSA
jgi:PAS domain S-box-containing protein/putative nucleotidyltransferase with HDIG domain